jgi:hypothetical protein
LGDAAVFRGAGVLSGMADGGLGVLWHATRRLMAARRMREVFIMEK